MKQRFSLMLVVLTVLYAVAIVVSNIIAGKLWDPSILGILLPSGVLLFPIVYIIGDVIPECYGARTAQKIIWVGFGANLFAVLVFSLVLILPFPPFWEGQTSFQAVLGSTPRLLLASLSAYLCGSSANAWILILVKKLTKGRFLWMRTISSTIIGEAIDSTIFILVAFLGVLPRESLPIMILSQWAFKTVYEIVATPLTYVVVRWVKKVEGISPIGSVR